jgi:hypothetical protein
MSMDNDFEHETGMTALDAFSGERVAADAALEAALQGDWDMMDFSLAAMVSPPEKWDIDPLNKKFNELTHKQKDVILDAATQLFLAAEDETSPQEAKRKLSVYFSLMDHVGRDGNDPTVLEDLAFEPERLDTLVARLAL